MLLTEIADAGCVDSSHQSLALLLMTLCPEDVSKIRTGKVSV
jgi:RNA 3'-terminal phosphate cyclase-like protein